MSRGRQSARFLLGAASKEDTMMVLLVVWGAALAGFVAGAAWNGRVRG